MGKVWGKCLLENMGPAWVAGTNVDSPSQHGDHATTGIVILLVGGFEP